MFRVPVLISSLLLSLTAAAQSTQNVTWTPGNQERFNLADCETDTQLQFAWDLTGNGGVYDLYVTYEFDGDCDPADNNVQFPDTGESIPVLVEDQFTLISGAQATDTATVSIFLPTEACFEGARNVVGVMCFSIYDTGLTDPRSRAHVFARNVIYDTVIPLKPVLESFSAADGAVSFTAAAASGGDLDDGPVTFQVQLRGCDDDAVIPEEFTGTAPDDGASAGGDAGVACGGDWSVAELTTENISVNGLSSTSTYELRVVAVDDFDNASPPSDIVSFTPIAEVGPLSVYEGGGTPYGFGCAQSRGAMPLALLGLLAGLALLRRRRGAAALLSLVILAGASSASAAPGRITADLWAGPYLPNLDREAGANDVYRCFFSNQLLPELGGDVSVGVFDAFGSLELGIGLSATQVTGVTFNREALLADPECKTPTEGGRSQLTMAKLRPHLAYRFDWLLDEFGFPLVPYGEVGLVGLGYSFTRNRALDDGGGADVPAAGAVFGWEGVLGLALELSFLDALDPFTPNTAKRARARGSFLHPFFFAELAIQEIDNFGGGGFVFSPRDDVLGTGGPMMLRFGVRLEM